MLSRRLGGALASTLLVAALCPGTRTAHAQAAPVAYWLPNWPIGFGGNLIDGPASNAYANFPSFDRNGARTGGVSQRYNFSNGWFVGSEAGGMGLNGIGPNAAFGNLRGLSYEGVQVGYNFQAAGNLPVTFHAGFNSLKYDAGIGNPFTSFDTSATQGYSVNAGVEFQPASNLSLSLGVGYTQQPGRINSLTGAAPFGR